jgi:MFS family permease
MPRIRSRPVFTFLYQTVKLMRPAGARVMTDNRNTGFFRILPLYFVIFIGFVGYSLMITILTPMILDNSGGILDSLPFKADRTIILGVLITLYPLGQVVGSPVMGAMSDRLGRRPILLVSLFVIAVCYSLFAYSLKIRHLPLLMLISVVMGLADADIVTAQSAIADVSTEGNRSRLFGYIYLSASSAYVVGPLIGGKLADPKIVPWFNYATPYWAVFFLLIITLVFTYFLFKETLVRREGAETSYFEAFTNILTIFTARRIRIIYLVNFLIYFSIFGFFRSYPMYLVDRFHMGVGRESDFIAWVAVPVVLANLWITGYLASRFSARTITIYSTLLFGILMSVIVVPAREEALWVTLFIAGLALAVALPACASMLSLMVSADEQGGVLGNNQSLQVGAEALSGLAAGLLAAVAFRLPLIALAGVAVLAALILAVEGRGRRMSARAE